MPLKKYTGRADTLTSTLQNQIGSFCQSLLSLDRVGIERLLQEGTLNTDPSRFIETIVVPALERIGSDWENGIVSLAEVYMSSRLCEELLEEFLSAHHIARKAQPRIAIAVLQDYHMLGKRMVLSVMQSAGFAVLDYGHVDVDGLVVLMLKDRIDIILISVLMLASALKVKELRKKLTLSGSKAKIVVGGAPFRFDQRLGLHVEADAVGTFASDAPGIVEKLAADSGLTQEVHL
ncbi:MAG: cobalamin B12-binding domain-containing protein [Candidatus Riflebacteria bacterium]|nr:cobalamin B12-binding domain-containing protein [Candidatus Riflebacteria bacterium]